ncbi:hypothetical protein EV589_1659 [Mycobacterium sp. BK558]|uniref:PASTA domain-containing protein n=1 Tax=Mycolicibacterium chlorophenolicum TaxID=37916 RepID=A0A0J6VB57_9MYCO|nr:hypothetical protein [Mycolicibacterium chlorophenolicum]KMO67439.1 hypothetical protein MCHLDSM_06688 [Mycolicibacterium chlorophenolicum]RZT25910.1 hypothetical protein EV589_1659 [Mycobacterium sp. BK558]
MRWAWMAVAAALGVALSPAGQAAAEDQNPSIVIEQLRSAGYTVNIDRVGSAPLENCTVLSVRNPQQVTQPVRVVDRNGRGRDVDVIDVVVHQSISVSLDCSH